MLTFGNIIDRENSSNADIATIIELRAMLVMSRTDPGMHDLLSRAKEYFILKGSPSLEEAVNEQKRLEAQYKETDEQKWFRIRNTPYGLKD